MPLSDYWRETKSDLSGLGRDEGGEVLESAVVWDEGAYRDVVEGLEKEGGMKEEGDDCKGGAVCYATCMCGLKGGQEISVAAAKPQRRSAGVSLKSARASAVQHELAAGTLNPHTLITCENYLGGPGLRFLSKAGIAHAGMHRQEATAARGFVYLSDSDGDEASSGR